MVVVRIGKLSKASDVFVIGGGPAGLAVALAARQRGMSVTVADSLAPPIDKPCGEGLMPDGIVALQRLGVSIPAIEASASAESVLSAEISLWKRGFRTERQWECGARIFIASWWSVRKWQEYSFSGEPW